MESGERLRILCLHGYRQNGFIFKNKLGSLRKILNKYAELVFIDAPHPANMDMTEDHHPSMPIKQNASSNPSDIDNGNFESGEQEKGVKSTEGNQDEGNPAESNESSKEDKTEEHIEKMETNESESNKSLEETKINEKSTKSNGLEAPPNVEEGSITSSKLDLNEICNENAGELSWWSNKEDGTFKGTNRNGPAYGFDVSLKKVENAWINNGPFQGILGFSQGACFAGLICLLAEKHMTIIKPEFAIICSGFISGSLAHYGIYSEMVDLPSLHIFGLNDEIITPEMSKQLMSHFKSGKAVRHDGGHYFPAASLQKNDYIAFIKERLLKHRRS